MFRVYFVSETAQVELKSDEYHFAPQRKRILWDRGMHFGFVQGVFGGV